MSPRGELLPEESFRLYAVCTRSPRKLAGEVSMEALQAGVYEVVRGTDRIRVIVLSEIPPVEHNALWNLFSATPDAVRYGAEHHRKHVGDVSTVLNRLYALYKIEGLSMPYTKSDFRRDAAREIFEEMTPDELRELGREMTHEKRLDFLRGLSKEDILALLETIQSPPATNGDEENRSD